MDLPFRRRIFLCQILGFHAFLEMFLTMDNRILHVLRKFSSLIKGFSWVLYVSLELFKFGFFMSSYANFIHSDPYRRHCEALCKVNKATFDYLNAQHSFRFLNSALILHVHNVQQNSVKCGSLNMSFEILPRDQILQKNILWKENSQSVT